jgi:hypothetical protein
MANQVVLDCRPRVPPARTPFYESSRASATMRA